MAITVSLDAMGGDHGLPVTIPAALSALEHDAELRLILVGKEADILPEVESTRPFKEGRLLVRNATEVVGMDEPPAQALRKKKDSSMRVAINLVKEGEADACVSAGNTGALMATARFVLRTIEGIDRPAICTILPTMHKHVYMLDLGANVDCTPEHLLQFAVMASALVNATESNAAPRVGLLNIGEEEIKGSELTKGANELLQEADLNYIGYVEGDEIYTGDADVIVCDGFVGNVALKTTEGLAKMISQFMREEFNRNIFAKLSAIVALPVLKAFRRRVDPRRYNGATLLGLQGTVIKSHGGADALSYETAIHYAVVQAKTRVPGQIAVRTKAILSGAA
ncbi:MAG: phosphate acyltransferase PlsX [Acidiferrobacterales bacterium]|nr:phosphate acyltransferase PlsX [Acidiferrobacterales bacterium]